MEMGRVFLPIMANGSPKRFTNKVTNIWVCFPLVRKTMMVHLGTFQPTATHPPKYQAKTPAIYFSQLPSTFKGESSWFGNKITIEKSGGKQDKCESAFKMVSYNMSLFLNLWWVWENHGKTFFFNILKKRFPQIDHFQVESFYNPKQPRPFLDLGHFWKLFYHGKMRKGPPHHDGVDSCGLHLSNLRLCRVWNIW